MNGVPFKRVFLTLGKSRFSLHFFFLLTIFFIGFFLEGLPTFDPYVPFP